MDKPEPTPLKVTAARFLRSVRIFTGSEVGTKAKYLFAGLIALLCGLSALNVVNNYVGRNFMTAIAERQSSEFIRQAIFYVCVFAALTVVGVIARFRRRTTGIALARIPHPSRNQSLSRGWGLLPLGCLGAT